MTGCISTQDIRHRAPARERLPRLAKASVFLPGRAKLTGYRIFLFHPFPHCVYTGGSYLRGPEKAQAGKEAG